MLERPTALLIDMGQARFNLLAWFLASEGWTTLYAETAAEGTRLLAHDHVDAVVLNSTAPTPQIAEAVELLHSSVNPAPFIVAYVGRGSSEATSADLEIHAPVNVDHIIGPLTERLLHAPSPMPTDH